MSLITNFENELKEYCTKNHFDFEKMKSLPRCGNKEVLFVQHYDPHSTGEGLNSDKPAEVVLSVIKNKDGSIKIEHGKNANKYLHI